MASNIGGGGRVEIERLYISVESDMTRLIAETKDGVKEMEVQLGQGGTRGEEAFSRMGGGATAFAGVLQGVVMGAVAALTTMLINMGAQAVAAIRQFFNEAVEVGAQFETYVTQFETLLGSKEAAEARIKDLAEFGLKTPFELPEIVEASRLLEVFGGEALATSDGLQLVGDTAAGVNRPFQELAFWFGRMYDALQSGRPFGEAALRLQEMGVLSGDMRSELERLQKRGEEGSVVWERFAEQIGSRFAGNMERLSATLQGIRSNLQDFLVNLQRVGGEPMFEQTKESAQELLDLLEERQPELEDLAWILGSILADFKRFFQEGLLGLAEDIDLGQVQQILRSLQETGVLIQSMLSGLQEVDSSTVLDNIQDAVEDLNNDLRNMLEVLAKIQAWVARRQAEAASLEERGIGLGIGKALRIANADAEALEAGQRAADEVMGEFESTMQRVDDRIKEVTSATRDHGEATEEVAASVKKETEELAAMSAQLEKLTGKITESFLDATVERQDQVVQLEKAHQNKLAEIVSEGIAKAAEMAAKLEATVTKLWADFTKQRDRLIVSAAEDIAETEQDYDKRREEEQASHRMRQLRATEDHFREMRRLTQRYLDDVQDAVRRRDARAVVDLQKRYMTERSQREEDFGVRQSREGQDHSDRLQELRDEEASRIREIQDGLAKELVLLEENTREREAELRQRNAEEMEQLRLKLEEETARENSAYQQRLLALDEAMRKRLEKTALALADERSLNEDHARRLLEAMNRVFGVGGDVDKLMEQFAARRKQRLIVEMGIEQAMNPQSQYIPGTPDYRMQHGGTILANRPTTVLFGEAGPEVASFTPLGRTVASGADNRQAVDLRISGSAPPGVGTEEVDAISRILLDALQRAGVLK